MHFRSLPFLSLLPCATALQSIYLGVDGSSGQLGDYIAFFSDSDPYQVGTRFGFLPYGFVNCNQDLTILGHPNITFTGCPQPCATSYPGCLPTGVSDNGAHALDCKNATNPPDAPGSEYGVYAVCEPGVSAVGPGFVTIKMYCS